MTKFKICLDTRVPKKNGKFPLTLRTTFDKNVRFMSLGADYSYREFDLIFNQTPTGKLIEIRNKANEILTKALMVNELLFPFDYNRFKELLKRDEVEKRQKT